MYRQHANTGMMDQPDKDDVEEQQIPSLWCSLIVGIKERKKETFPPFVLAVVTAVVCHLESSWRPLGSTRPSAFICFGGEAVLGTVPHLGSCGFAHSWY